MHDRVPSYDPDVVVVDVVGPRPRTITSELTMQILTMGAWHRRTPDLAFTSCGLAYHAQFAPVRRESHAGPLCTICFTDFEIACSADLEKTDKEGTR